MLLRLLLDHDHAEEVHVEDEVHRESYVDLLMSVPHWMFEATTDLVFGLLLLAAGWVWRNSILKHMHRDIAAEHARLDAEHGISPEQHRHPAFFVKGPWDYESECDYIDPEIGRCGKKGPHWDHTHALLAPQ